MGIKSKVLGIVAAAGLSLSLVSGAIAADSGDMTGNVVLEPGLCGITVSQSNTSFGTYKWDGTQYVAQPGTNPEIVLTNTVVNHKPGGKCNLTFSTTGLTNGTAIIPSNLFKASLFGGTYGNVPAIPLPTSGAISLGQVNSGTHNIGVKLTSVPNNFAPGTYSGTATLTVTNGN